MNEEFRGDPKNRGNGLVIGAGSLLPTGVVFLFSCADLFNGPSWEDLLQALAFSGMMFLLTSPLLGFAVYLLLWLKRHRLRISAELVQVVDVFRERQVRLSEVESVQWGVLPPRIRLESKNDFVEVTPGDYTDANARRIMRWVREEFPLELQKGFESYYEASILPDARRKEKEKMEREARRLKPVSEADPAAGDVIVPRWRFGSVWIASFLLFTILAIALTAMTAVLDWRFWIGPPGVVIGWFASRFLIPREGVACTREHCKKARDAGLVLLAILLIMPLTQFSIAILPERVLEWGVGVFVVGGLIGFAVFIPFVVKSSIADRERRRREVEGVLAKHGPIPPELLDEDEVERST